MALLGVSLALAACDDKKQASDALPLAQSGPLSVAVTTLFPGGGTPPPPDPRGKLYEGQAAAIGEGSRLFDWYNCSGCHFHGGGGIGPAFMTGQWRYGGRIDQIYASIFQGRPNGMPSWARKIPDAQIWQIAAYVKSLSTSDLAQAPMPTKPPPAVTGDESRLPGIAPSGPPSENPGPGK